MTIINTVQEWLASLDTKAFYRYVAGLIGAMILLIIVIIYFYYSSCNYYKNQIRRINNQRQEVQALLEKAALVEQQKQEVYTIIEQDPSFKIVGYFDKVLAQLNLTNKKDLTKDGTQERPNEQYNEKILSARFTEMTMKELVELLHELEQNKRIYIKDLEIERSKKNNRRIDARLSIATFETRSE